MIWLGIFWLIVSFGLLGWAIERDNIRYSTLFILIAANMVGQFGAIELGWR